MSGYNLSRRRAITVIGVGAGISLLPLDRPSRGAAPLYQWNGTSLGSPSHVLLSHPSREAAARAMARCAEEIERLERIFGLYRGDSEITRLNRDGRIASPSSDLICVLSECSRLSALSGGAFDVTVQPLWDAYAAHFFASRSRPAGGPDPRAIAAAVRLVDWQQVNFGPGEVVLGRPGMGLTLNGIAQGYVADRIIGILRDCGFGSAFADLGHSELFALGLHPTERPWRVGLADPRQPANVAITADLLDCSLCTSGGYGTRFEPSGKYHHLFVPGTGQSASHYIAVSVFSQRAMVADALSTALYVAPPDRSRELLAGYPGASALVTRPDGTMERLPG
ncbi:MAG: FAD:protein FMN transferase [Acetobacteraceae bacterium]|nr:FAD:protein FMN transferase [Acetobacteraceae bacterium]